MNDRLVQEWKALAVDAVRLDDLKFLKVFRLLEQLAETPGIQPAFDTLRSRLASLRPPRRPSASRVFFRPTEDLLDDPGSYERRLNRVCRTALTPCWRAIKDRIDKGVLTEFSQAMANTDPRDAKAVIEAGTAIWQCGALAIKEVVDLCKNNLKFKVDNFGRDDDVLRQMEMIASVVAIGPDLESLKMALPSRPIGDLAEGHVEAIRAALSKLGKEEAARSRPMLMVLSSRMKRPGDLLKLLGDVTLGTSMGEKEQLTRELSGYVVGNLLRQTGDFDRSGAASGASGGARSAAASAEAERLTEGLNSVNDTVMGLRDRDLTNRVNSARTEIGVFVVKNIVTDVDKNIIGTLFGQEGLVASDKDVKEAENMALALRRSLKLAPQLGIAKEVNAKLAEVRKSVESATNKMLRSSAAGKSGPDPEAQRQMFNSLRMIEILAGSDEAERLFREWKQQLN